MRDELAPVRRGRGDRGVRQTAEWLAESSYLHSWRSTTRCVRPGELPPEPECHGMKTDRSVSDSSERAFMALPA
jgi:hypothetical protein